MNVQPKCTATAIGSLPVETPEQALEIILSSIPNAPIWPQLPKFGLLEQMEIQYAEGLPRMVIDKEKSRMYFNTSGDYSEELAAFYEGFMAAEESGDYSVAAIGPDFSHGLPALFDKLTALGGKRPFVKVQVTGPLSFALTITDENKRAIFYNEEFCDVVVKGIAMKARWQIQKFRHFAENVICFIDEPILSAFGSSTYVSVQHDDVVSRLGEVVQAVQAEGALAGVHCCGNTEWSLLVDAGVDIINFDAFEFGETIALYPEQMKKHLLQNKGALAFGVVPTSAIIREQTVESLVAQFDKIATHLATKLGIDKQIIVEQAFVTPSCGTGSMAVEDAERVFKLLGETSQALQEKYGFATVNV